MYSLSEIIEDCKCKMTHLLKMNDTHIPMFVYEHTATDRKKRKLTHKRLTDQNPWRQNKPGMAYTLVLMVKYIIG
jgi:hypothetical protein